MDNYFDLNETEDFQLLKDLNKALGWFKTLDKTPPKHHADASGHTRDNRTAMIEIKRRHLSLSDDLSNVIGKSRDGSTFIQPTIFIEGHKCASLLLDAIDGYVPLYINFLDNAAVVFDLSNLKTRPREEVCKEINSKGYNSWEQAKRQGLYLTDAIILKDGKVYKQQ